MRGRTGLILMLTFNVFVFTKAYQVTDDACTFECNTDTYQCKAVGKTQFWGFNCNDRDCREVLHTFFLILSFIYKMFKGL